MVRLRRRSTDHGRASHLGYPTARTAAGQRSYSVARVSGGGAEALGINSEQLEHLRKLANIATETNGSSSIISKVSYSGFYIITSSFILVQKCEIFTCQRYGQLTLLSSCSTCDQILG